MSLRRGQRTYVSGLGFPTKSTAVAQNIAGSRESCLARLEETLHMFGAAYNHSGRTPHLEAAAEPWGVNITLSPLANWPFRRSWERVADDQG